MTSSDSAYSLMVADSARDFASASELFREYAAQLNVDLCFQGFAAELLRLSVMYGPPTGCLVLVMHGGRAVGCGALRSLGDGVCEMKRLYLRPAARGAHWGRRIAEHLIAAARAMGYLTMRLDTLTEMAAARRLYESLGFREIAAYYANPLGGTVYMELTLSVAGEAFGG